MKKYITLAALLAAGTAFANATDTAKLIHDVNFNVEVTEESKLTDSTACYYIHDLTTSTSPFSPNTTFKGFYLGNGAGMKFNNAGPTTVDYLYIDETLSMCEGTTHVKGQINWSNTNGTTGFKINNSGWVDINANYGQHINVSAMTSGAIYLNKNGELTVGELNTGVSVYAEFNADEAERTLLTGDFSTWTDEVIANMVTISGLDKTMYEVIGDSQGLKIEAINVPEPSAFGLLAGLGALALVGTRRRRK